LEYLILSAKNQAGELNSFGNTLGLSKWPQLNNDQDHLVLSLDGNSIFDIAYSRTWYGDFSKENGGYSLEMIDVENPCAGKVNWTSSASSIGGTPGVQNSVSGVRIDHRGPSVDQVFPIADSILVIDLNETLNPETVNSADLRLSPHLGDIVELTITNNQIRVGFDQRFETGKQYEIAIDNITDCVGNLIEPSPSVHQFVIPEVPLLGDIQLSELLYDPKPGGSDFLEIYNNSSKFIDLQGWWISNDTESDGVELLTIQPQDLIVGPFEFRVFSNDPSTIPDEYPNFNSATFIETDLSNFPNGEGSVVLANPQKEVWDHLHYSEEQHFALLKDTEGVSLERVSFEIDTNEPGNWQSALQDFGYASPGLPNSQSRPLVQTKGILEVDPRVFLPQKNNGNLVSIVYQFPTSGNIGSLRIYDLAGREVKTIAHNYMLGATGQFLWDGTDDNLHLLRSGPYLVLLEWFNLDGQVDRVKKLMVIGSR